MDVTGDELAGIVDLFDALTRGELAEALAELAYKHGAEYDPDAYEDDIEAAIESFDLLAVGASAIDHEGNGGSQQPAADSSYLVPGPVAFPTLPEGATDLVHILDVPERSVDRERVRGRALERFRQAAAEAVDADDSERVDQLMDVSYEIEAWAAVDLSAEREQMRQE